MSPNTFLCATLLFAITFPGDILGSFSNYPISNGICQVHFIGTFLLSSTLGFAQLPPIKILVLKRDEVVFLFAMFDKPNNRGVYQKYSKY